MLQIIRTISCTIIIGMIRLYQYGVSPLLGTHCRFEPSCSRYTEEAINTHGVIKGTWLAIKRISRCHPLGTSNFDPVPPKQQPTP